MKIFLTLSVLLVANLPGLTRAYCPQFRVSATGYTCPDSHHVAGQSYDTNYLPGDFSFGLSTDGAGPWNYPWSRAGNGPANYLSTFVLEEDWTNCYTYIPVSPAVRVVVSFPDSCFDFSGFGFAAARLRYWGNTAATAYSYEFDVFKDVSIPGNSCGVDAVYDVEAPSSAYTNDALIVLVRSTSLGLRHPEIPPPGPVWQWEPPHTPKDHGPPWMGLLSLNHEPDKSFSVQLISDLSATNSTTLTNLTTDSFGYGEVSLEVSGESGSFKLVPQ